MQQGLIDFAPQLDDLDAVDRIGAPAHPVSVLDRGRILKSLGSI